MTPKQLLFAVSGISYVGTPTRSREGRDVSTKEKVVQRHLVRFDKMCAHFQSVMLPVNQSFQCLQQ